MKGKRIITLLSFVFMLALTLSVSSTLVAGERDRPDEYRDNGCCNSNAFRDTFDQLLNLAQQWGWGNLYIPPDGNGNAVLGGNVVIMPIPASPGDGTPGSIDVTLSSKQAFVLPLWNWLGAVYDDPNSPADPEVPSSVYRTLDIKFTIDGETVVDSCNVMEYYTESRLDPPIPYIWAPAGNLVSLQGIGVVHTPLPLGHHTFKLDVKNVQPVIDGPGNSWIFEYHNTWHVTVKRGK